MKRQNTKGLIALAFSAALLTACATSPTLYGPQTGPRGAGYSEYRLEAGRYRVTQQTGSGRGSSLSIGGGSGSYGRRSGVGLGVGTSFNLGPGPAVSSSMEVVFGKGQPPHDADVYDARAIVRTVGQGRAAVLTAAIFVAVAAAG
jgi:hypothetical protein